MNILVLNGSPKGEYSITLQTVRYLEKRYPAHSFEVLHVGQRIKSLEKELVLVSNWQEKKQWTWLFCNHEVQVVV